MCDIFEGDDPAWDEAGADLERGRLADLARFVESMESSNAEWAVYQGPQDGLAGPFCGALVGYAIPVRYLKRLLNPRGRPVLEDCGGHRCRHMLSPISSAFVSLGRFPIITDEQIEAVSRAAGRIRRQRELKGRK